MSSLTDEQKRKVEENRQKALKLRAEKQRQREATIDVASSANASAKDVSLSPKRCRSPHVSAGPFRSNTTAVSFSTPPLNKILRGNCALISRTRFIVNDIGYHKGLIDIFKQISSCLYDATDRKWSFLIKDHEELLAKAKVIKSEVVLHPLPTNILKTFENVSEQREIPNVDLSSVDSVLTEALFPFQYDGICFGIAKKGRVLLADDMGLGKTIQAIGIAAYYRNEWPLLVIAPSSVRYTWQMAFRKWLPSLPIDSLLVVDSAKCPIGKDESHFLKNYKTARANAILPLLKRARRVCLLSGTPALSRPSELFTQLSSISPSVFFSMKEFGCRYCDAKQTPWGPDYSGAKNMPELQILMEEVLMIRRLKADVLSQLPEKRREMVLLDPTELKVNTKRMTVMSDTLEKELLSGMRGRGLLLQYFHETGSSKLKAVCNYIEYLLESGKKFLCFAHHQIVLDGICDTLVRKNYRHIRIDGRTNSEVRNQLCEKFQLNDSYRVAVLSITAANMGITLTSAQLVVFAELFWNPGILTQAEDRVHRIGQTDSVLCQYLVAKGTADDYLWPLVRKKLDVLNRAGLSKDNFNQAECKLLCTNKQKTLDKFLRDENVTSLLETIDWEDNTWHTEEPVPKKMCM